MKTALTSLLHSRKFLVMVTDVIIATAIYFVGKYALPTVADDVLWLIGSYQPVVLFVIGSITAEDVAAYNNGSHPTQSNTTSPLG